MSNYLVKWEEQAEALDRGGSNWSLRRHSEQKLQQNLVSHRVSSCRGVELKSLIDAKTTMDGILLQPMASDGRWALHTLAMWRGRR